MQNKNVSKDRYTENTYFTHSFIDFNCQKDIVALK